MQALISFMALLSLASAAHLTLLPYAYLADPLPVYHQSQNTRTGEHAYSYAGGPSAKEEVKGPDGVTRGSYSYLDAHGILQSVFYVADEGGFRVAATNLPTDNDLPVEPAGIILARSAHLEERAKAEASARRKRSLTETDEKGDQQEGQSDPASKNEQQQQMPEKSSQSEASSTPSVLLATPSVATATSHQSRFQVHQNVRAEPLTSDDAISVEAAAPLLQPVGLLSSLSVPLATSHQSRLQIHGDTRLENGDGPSKAEDGVKNDTSASFLSVSYSGEGILETPLEITGDVPPRFPSYYQNRLLLHRSLGLEGVEPKKDAVKIETAPVLQVQPIFTDVRVPLLQQNSHATAVSSQSRTQIHKSSKFEIPATIAIEPAVYFETPTAYVQPLVTQLSPVLHALPLSQSTQYRSQIHSSQRLEVPQESSDVDQSAGDSKNLTTA